MAITVGVDFRATLGYVSGGASGNGGNANYTTELSNSGGVANYPVSFGGTTIGWEDGNADNGNGRDRDNSLDVRIAGITFNDSGTTSTYRIDLPSAGTYSIQIGLGDGYAAQANQQLVIKDNATTKATISGATGGAAQFFGANGTLYTSSAAWAAANTVGGGGAAQIDVTFSSTIARFTIGSGTGATALAHIFITGPTGGSNVSIAPPRKDVAFSAFVPDRAVNTYLYPDADVTDGGWLNENESNTNLYASIDEFSISDADYIKSGINPSNDQCEINLSNSASTPAEPFEVFYRYKKTGTGQIDLTVDLVQGTTIKKTWTHTDISTSYVTAQQTLSGAEFASISDFNNLRLRFKANKV